MTLTPAPTSNHNPGAKRVLIVEDEPLIAFDLRSEIEANHHIVVGQCGSAKTAIAMAGELRPDLVVMDIGLLGDYTGLDAARDIRARYNIGCIFVSATLDRVNPQSWNDIRPIALIRKPYRDDALADAIAKSGSDWKAVKAPAARPDTQATPLMADETPALPATAVKLPNKSQTL